MHFEFTQRFDAPVDRVAAALCDPGYLEVLADAPKLGAAELLDRAVDGDRVVLQVRYRFAGDLSSAARAVLDPSKLTWIERSIHDLAAHTVTFVLEPDHYADRFSARGGYRLEAEGDATRRRAEGELKVRAPLIASTVERAIISGLGEHLEEEPSRMHRWLAEG